MRTQNQIKKTLSETVAIEHIREVLDENRGLNRTGVAEKICEDFGFVNARGELQRAGCLKALRTLEKKGNFDLPKAARHSDKSRAPRGLVEAVPAPEGVADSVEKVKGLELIYVEQEDHLRIWNELMIREHPRGAGPLVGRQVRYLIGSETGWLGGLGFASCALHLGDRDRWIGWDLEMKEKHLDQVVGLARLLIRPSVKCGNLASYALGACMREFPKDFEKRYGYRPWLVETFVDRSLVQGTCYRAANWTWIGRTQGRGRQDREKKRAETVKDIYVYILDEDFRSKMGLPDGSGLSPLSIGESLDAEGWAEREFGDAPFGDGRLSTRLVIMGSGKAEKPDRPFTGVFQGDKAGVKAAYRFIEQPNDSEVTMENILLPHREQTVRRMKAQDTVLCIQDGTDLNYTNLAQCEGLGEIGTNQTGAKSRGLHLHSTMVVGTDGIPLGVLKGQLSAPEPKEDPRPSYAIPIEEKETFSWIVGVRDCMDLAFEMPHTQQICVMDREADIFEVFHEQRENPCVDLLIRAKYNRCTTEDVKLFDAVKETKVKGQFRVEVKRQSARPKKSKQKAKPKRPGRMADVNIRYRQIELKPAKYNKDKPPIPIWIIHAREEKPPSGASPIEWFLLTTIQIECPEDAEQCIRWYCLRWRIEDWHRALKKGGCQTEDLAYSTALHLERGIAINMVIAWRIMLMALMGRETPDLPADVLFTDVEIKVLQAYARKKKLTPPTCVGEAVVLVGKLGGHLGRKSDPPPGYELLWRGYSELQLMRMGYELYNA